MTTIAFDGHILAIDSQVTEGKNTTFENKLWKYNDGHFCIAGFWADYPIVRKALNAGTDASTKKSSVVWSKGRSVYYTDGPSTFKARKGLAWGSGSSEAMAAMLAGADAVEAVKIAAKLNTGTGGKVRYTIVS